jgi:hypothetical protein
MIDAHGTARRNVGCEKRNETEPHRDADKRKWVSPLMPNSREDIKRVMVRDAAIPMATPVAASRAPSSKTSSYFPRLFHLHARLTGEVRASTTVFGKPVIGCQDTQPVSSDSSPVCFSRGNLGLQFIPPAYSRLLMPCRCGILV